MEVRINEVLLYYENFQFGVSFDLKKMHQFCVVIACIIIFIYEQVNLI